MATTDTGAAAEDVRTIVYLGNHQASAVEDGQRVPDPGKKCTTVSIPGDKPLMEAVNDIAGASGLWQAMSFADAPAWVAAEGPLAGPITQLLAAHYRCAVREPDPGSGA